MAAAAAEPPPTNFFYVHRKTPIAIYHRHRAFVETTLGAEAFASVAEQTASRVWRLLTRATRPTSAPAPTGPKDVVEIAKMRERSVKLERDQLQAIPFDVMLGVAAFLAAFKESTQHGAVVLGGENIVDALGLEALPSVVGITATAFTLSDLYLALTDNLVVTSGEHNDRFDVVWLRTDSDLFHALYERRHEPKIPVDLRVTGYYDDEATTCWFVGTHISQFHGLVSVFTKYAFDVHEEAKDRVF